MKRLVGCVLIMLISVGCVWAVTQWSAAHVSIGDRGPALAMVFGYPLYPPYQVIVWWIMSETSTADALLPAMGVSMAILFGAILLLRSFGVRDGSRAGDRYISGARWATREDLRKNGLL